MKGKAKQDKDKDSLTSDKSAVQPVIEENGGSQPMSDKSLSGSTGTSKKKVKRKKGQEAINSGKKITIKKPKEITSSPEKINRTESNGKTSNDKKDAANTTEIRRKMTKDIYPDPEQTTVSDSSGKPDGYTMLSQLMPGSEAEQSLLKERSRHFAKPIEVSRQKDYERFIRFRLGRSEEYGIPYKFTSETIRVSEIIEVPHAPAHVSGIISLRGVLMSVIDPKYFFRAIGTDEASSDPTIDNEACVIVVSSNGLTLALLVDEILGDGAYVNEELDTPIPSNGIQDMAFVKGIYDGSVTIIDIQSLLGSPDFHIKRIN